MTPGTPAERLADLLHFRTVSDPAERDESQFAGMRARLAELYPRVHALEPIPLDDGSLFLRWAGRSAEGPLVLMAHHDVVPAPAAGWTHAPFGGVIADGRIHGRGALDDKGALVCLMEAVEGLLAEGHVPARDVYLFSGADEETEGRGASLAATRLHDHDVRPWLVSDEGGALVGDLFPGVDGEIALVGVAEKGTVDLQLVARGEGGHSSTPAPGSAVERLSEAVLRVCRLEPETLVAPAVRAMLQALTGYAPADVTDIVNHSDEDLARRLSTLGPELGAQARSTMTVTRLAAGHGDNVIAPEARATVNARLAPGDSPARLVRRLTDLVGDLGVEVTDVHGDAPSPESPTAGPQWELLQRAVAALTPDEAGMRVVPYLQTGSTDSRYFASFSDAVYRLAPLTMTAAQRGSIHGVDEYVTVTSLERGIAFHRALVLGLPD